MQIFLDLIFRLLNVNKYSELLGIEYQVLRNKIYRNKFSFEEMQHIADALGFDLKAVKRD